MKKVFEGMKVKKSFQVPEPLKQLPIIGEKEGINSGARFMSTQVYDCSSTLRDSLRVEEAVMLKGDIPSCLVEEDDYIYADK